jgi:hypothetical protein
MEEIHRPSCNRADTSFLRIKSYRTAGEQGFSTSAKPLLARTTADKEFAALSTDGERAAALIAPTSNKNIFAVHTNWADINQSSAFDISDPSVGFIRRDALPTALPPSMHSCSSEMLLFQIQAWGRIPFPDSALNDLIGSLGRMCEGASTMVRETIQVR